ncbi:phosphatase 2C-like domain-containing protein [Powellomyces hirtus]|nr:phosphatase 2C-like domain-containing protein [Powellomyces hirtus]
MSAFVHGTPASVTTFNSSSRSSSRSSSNKAVYSDVEWKLKQIYHWCRSHEALGTIERISEALDALDADPSKSSNTSTLSSASAFWRHLRRLDPRITASPPTTTTTSSPHEDTTTTTWAFVGRRGWWASTSTPPHGLPKPLHEDLEDVLYTPRAQHALTTRCGLPVRIFCLADGHGGRGAAEWFVGRVPGAVEAVLASRAKWDLEAREDCEGLKRAVRDIYTSLDDEFCRLRGEEYSAIVAGGSGTLRDDGCTLNLVVVINNRFLLSAHVGDSRTLVGKITHARIDLVHATTDHTPADLPRAAHIVANGGVLRFSKQDPPITLNGSDTPHHDLASARVFRPPGFVNPYGFAVKNLGMADAMGDVVFKVEPRLFWARPDVEVLDMEGGEYLVVVASDGVFGALREDLEEEDDDTDGEDGDCKREEREETDHATVQNTRVLDSWTRMTNLTTSRSDTTTNNIDEHDNDMAHMPALSSNPATPLADSLKQYAQALCDRHTGTTPVSNLFADIRRRTLCDDVAVIVVHVNCAEQ